MPGSRSHGKPDLRNWIFTQPARQQILDVGCGKGDYRNWLNRRRGSDYWCGIDIWAPYVPRFDLENKYDKIIITDIRYFNWYRSFDLVIFGDILEHMVRSDAVKVVRAASQHARHIAISIPFDDLSGGDENPWMDHQENWTQEDVARVWPTAERLDAAPAGRRDYKGMYLLKGTL